MDRATEALNLLGLIPESGAIAIFYFSFSAENVGSFYFLLFFGPKMKLLFRFYIFWPKKENPFTVGL